ncbi:MAG TPA: stage II sporulation protein M [Syntrophomonadaceae bacterium]|nr:stage II sporulation protein M [Syntrophomonadaceae bacterium]
MNNRHLIKRHISENRWQYIIMTLIFLSGVVMGNYKVPGLQGGVKSTLLALVDGYLQGGMEGSLQGSSILYHAFLTQGSTLLAIWFLGLTVLGLPLILAIIFMRGYSLGFTLGFLIRAKGGGGALIGLLTIIPQNLVYIPFLLIWAVVATNFSLQVLRGNPSGFSGLLRRLMSYCLLMLFFLLLCLVGAFIEAYLSPWLLSLVM